MHSVRKNCIRYSYYLLLYCNQDIVNFVRWILYDVHNWCIAMCDVLTEWNCILFLLICTGSQKSPKDYVCLLDVLHIELTDMDLYSAVRIEKRERGSYQQGKAFYWMVRGKRKSKRTRLCKILQVMVVFCFSGDLSFSAHVVRRQGGPLLKEKCALRLQVERNLDGDISHAG